MKYMSCKDCKHYNTQQESKMFGHICNLHEPMNSDKCKDYDTGLKWMVYNYDFNKKEIITYDIFHHGRFSADVEELLCDKNITYDEFKEKLKRRLMYYYWSKTEWEIVLKPWVGDDNVAEKIDVYDQVTLNFDKFVDYVWRYKNGKCERNA